MPFKEKSLHIHLFFISIQKTNANDCEKYVENVFLIWHNMGGFYKTSKKSIYCQEDIIR